MTMIVYGHPNSRSTRATWALEEAGLDWEYRKVDLMKGEGRQEPYRSINPAGKVPALQDGSLIITESMAICTYIGDMAPESSLTPQNDIALRAHYNQWCSFAVSELEQPLWTMGKHRFVFPESKRIPTIMEVAAWEFSRAATLLSDALGDRATILGDTFTVADLLLAHTLKWAMAFKVPLGHDNLQQYADRHLSRPALKSAVEKEQVK